MADGKVLVAVPGGATKTFKANSATARVLERLKDLYGVGDLLDADGDSVVENDLCAGSYVYTLVPELGFQSRAMAEERVWVRFLDSTLRFRCRNGRLDADEICKKWKLDPESLSIGPDVIDVGDDGLSKDTVVEIRQAASEVGAGDGKSQHTPFLLEATPSQPFQAAAAAGHSAPAATVALVDRTAEVLKALAQPEEVFRALTQPDYIDTVLEGARISELPQLRALSGFLDKLPDGIQFPVVEKTYGGLCLSSLGPKVFRRSGPLDRFEDSQNFAHELLNPADAHESEGSFHGLWDACLYKPVKRFLRQQAGIVNARTQTGETTELGKRCDATYYVESYALLKGEEKAAKTSGDPEQELKEKDVWPYLHSIPYVLGYTTRAYRLVLYALYRQEGSERYTETQLLRLKEFDLMRLQDRISLFVASFQIARLLRLLKEVCVRKGVQPDETLERSRGKVVELIGYIVRKTYEASSRASAVLAMYSAIAQCPNVEEVLHVNQEKRRLVVSRGIPRRPVTPKELQECLLCVVEALIWLHEQSIMHRDLRWDNVLQSRTDSGKWFIIDFDDACASPSAEGNPRLAPENHAPEMAGPHDVKVDIWGVGYLIRKSGTVTPRLTTLMHKCLHADPTCRPTASECKAFLVAAV